MSAAVAAAAHNLAADSCRLAIAYVISCPVNDAIYVIRSCICETVARLDSQKKLPVEKAEKAVEKTELAAVTY